MNSLDQAKTLGGIGSILILLVIFPIVGIVLSIIGTIMVLIAVKYISETVKDKTIFKNMLIAVILNVAGSVWTILIAGRLFPYFREFRQPYPWMLALPRTFLITLIITLVVVWVLHIGSAIFLRKSYTIVASKLNISMFSTTALLYMIGAVLTIILVGFIVIYIAFILQTVAFFSISNSIHEKNETEV